MRGQIKVVTFLILLVLVGGLWAATWRFGIPQIEAEKNAQKQNDASNIVIKKADYSVTIESNDKYVVGHAVSPFPLIVSWTWIAPNQKNESCEGYLWLFGPHWRVYENDQAKKNRTYVKPLPDDEPLQPKIEIGK